MTNRHESAAVDGVTPSQGSEVMDMGRLVALEFCGPAFRTQASSHQSSTPKLGVTPCYESRFRNDDNSVLVWRTKIEVDMELYLPPAEFHHIALCLGGGHTVTYGINRRTQTHVAEPHEISIVPAFTPAFVSAKKSSANTDDPVFETVHVMLCPQRMQRMAWQCADASVSSSRLGFTMPTQDNIAAHLILGLADYTGLYGAGKAFETLCASLCGYLLSRYGVEQEGAPIGALRSDQINAVRKLMLNHLDAAPKTGMMAAQLGLRPSHFNAAFRAATGMTPLDFYRDLRMKRAHQLVKETRRSLTDIANDLGFADAAHFSKSFRLYWGAPPSILRRSIPAPGG